MKKILTNTLPLCLAFVLTACDSRFSGHILYASGRLTGFVIAIVLFAALFYWLIGLFKKDLTKKARWGWAFGIATIVVIFLMSLGQSYK